MPDDKWSCAGSVDPTKPVTMVDGNGDIHVLNPGDELTIKRNDSDKITLSNGGGTQSMEIHTCCSQPLVAGEDFGNLTLVALDGQRAGTQVIYTLRHREQR